MSEAVFLDALLMVTGTVAFLGLLSFLRRYLEFRASQRPRIAVDGLQERLDRIESVVESTAIEVERISEANRFMSQLIADPAGVSLLKKVAERTVTPH